MRGRPRRGSIRFVLTLRLDPDLDADLLEWLTSIPIGERVQTLKRALRSGGLGSSAAAEPEDDQEAQEAAKNILGAWNF